MPRVNGTGSSSQVSTGAALSPVASAVEGALAIRTQGLSKRYGKKQAVDQLTFQVPKGSIFGFLGPNGAGKTTTFAMLCGFVQPSAGTAFVLDEPISHVYRLGGRCGALPQDASFQPDRTVLDSVRFLAELGGFSPTDALVEAERVLERVGLLDSRHVRGKALSHGMAKRFGIAQAFLGNPELVLLDEPTEGLDPRTAFTIRGLVKSLAGRSTVLISSHNLSEVQDICDHAAIIDKGKLVTQGTIATLTGSDEQVLIGLGWNALASGLAEGTMTLPWQKDRVKVAMGGMEALHGWELSADGLRLRVSIRPKADQSVESAITAILRGLMGAGLEIGSVSRGRSLEERFLELT